MIFFLFAFLLGSVPFGILVARLFDVPDLRNQGSGNIGATNVSRVAGFWPAGFLAFLLDFLKGVFPVVLVHVSAVWRLLDHFPAALSGAGGLEDSAATAWACGLFAVWGHCYTPWLKFKGGKGVATGFGALMVLAPVPALIGLVGFALMFLKSRVASLSCITGLIVASVACLSIATVGPHLWLGGAMVFTILVRHEENINALLENRERAFR